MKQGLLEKLLLNPIPKIIRKKFWQIGIVFNKNIFNIANKMAFSALKARKNMLFNAQKERATKANTFVYGTPAYTIRRQ